MEFREINLGTRPGIRSYGSGGFRVGQDFHQGSLILLPSRSMAWPVTQPQEITPDSLKPVIEDLAEVDVLLIGSGKGIVFPKREVRRTLEDAGLGYETMDTGAACRTYNVLLAEGRRVAAALIAID